METKCELQKKKKKNKKKKKQLKTKIMIFGRRNYDGLEFKIGEHTMSIAMNLRI